MNGKVINLIPTNLSSGGIFTATAASPVVALRNNIGAATLTVTQHTKAIAISSEGYTGTQTIDITKSGYTPLGIVSVDSGRYDFAFRRYLISGNEARVSVYCDAYSAAERTSIVSVWVLYIKN